MRLTVPTKRTVQNNLTKAFNSTFWLLKHYDERRLDQLLNFVARHLTLHPNKPLQYEDLVPMSGILHILTIGIGLVEPVDENWVAHFQTGHVGDLIQLNEPISVHIQGFHNFVHIHILQYEHSGEHLYEHRTRRNW